MEIFALVRFREPSIADSIYKLERVGEELYWVYHGVAHHTPFMNEEPILLPTFERSEFYGSLIYNEEEFRRACENTTSAFICNPFIRFDTNGQVRWVVDGHNSSSHIQE